MNTFEPLTQDNPFAFDAREFVRDKVLNKNIFCVVWKSNSEMTQQRTIRYWGDIYYQENKHVTKSLTNELVAADMLL